MNIPCPVEINCEGSDWPILNLSSEGFERLTFWSPRYPPWQPYQPPTINRMFTQTDCWGVSYSADSQAMADLLALLNSIECANTYTCVNDPQTATIRCPPPDDTMFSYTTPAGVFASTYDPNIPGSLEACIAAANAQALAYAQSQLPIELFCLPDTHDEALAITPLLRCTCLGVAYTGQISAGRAIPLTWTISAGSLPPGLTFHGGYNITGTVTIDGVTAAAGSYSFTVRATLASGSFAEKTYTITVITIATTALPDYTIGTPYSFQLVAAGGSGNYSWAVSAGSLPNGLDLSATGLISGTPT